MQYICMHALTSISFLLLRQLTGEYKMKKRKRKWKWKALTGIKHDKDGNMRDQKRKIANLHWIAILSIMNIFVTMNIFVNDKSLPHYQCQFCTFGKAHLNPLVSLHVRHRHKDSHMVPTGAWMGQMCILHTVLIPTKFLNQIHFM